MINTSQPGHTHSSKTKKPDDDIGDLNSINPYIKGDVSRIDDNSYKVNGLADDKFDISNFEKDFSTKRMGGRSETGLVLPFQIPPTYDETQPLSTPVPVPGIDLDITGIESLNKK